MENYALPTPQEYTGDIEKQQQMVDEQAQYDVAIKERQEQQLNAAAETKAGVEQKEDPRNDGVGFNLGDIGA